MTARTHKVFVYGSLLSGLYNNEVLTHDSFRVGKFKTLLVPMTDPGRLLGKATTAMRFTMHDLGSFPACVPGGPAPVKGEVWEVTDAGLAALDRLEGYRPHSTDGGLYDRREVRLRGGSKALMYFMPTAPAYSAMHLGTVPSGDWRAHEEARPDSDYSFMFSDDS